MWVRGLRWREHVAACIELERALLRRGESVLHDRFWDVPAEEHAELHPQDDDAELKFRYLAYQCMLRAETHERLDPPRDDRLSVVHPPARSFETGRWESFVRETNRQGWVERRVRSRLLSRAVPEGLLEEMTQEIAQEVWVRACSSLGSFDPRAATLEAWMQGVVTRTALLSLERRKKSFSRESFEGNFLEDIVPDRCEEGLAERAIRRTSNEEFERDVLPFLVRSRRRRLVERVLDDEPLRGSDHRTWEGHRRLMQVLCRSRGFAPSGDRVAPP
jgi:DNA-directed RNA polymerase specialized sigma24 family protein